MTHFRVSDGAAFHAKLVAAGNEAVGAWARAGSWSASPENLTDGLIPAGVAAAIAPAKVWKRALDAGLVEARPGGAYQIHDYLDRNPSAAKVRAEREAWAARQRKARGESPPESQPLSRRDIDRDSLKESPTTSRVNHSAPDPDPLPDPGEKREIPPMPPQGAEPEQAVLPGHDQRPPRARGKRKPATTRPADWMPTEGHYALGAKHGMAPAAVDAEADRFRDHHDARGSTFADWDAAFRTWLGNVDRFKPAGSSRTALQPPARAGQAPWNMPEVIEP